MTLEEIKKLVLPACREFKVKRLDVVGSLARDQETGDSDVVILAQDNRQ